MGNVTSKGKQASTKSRNENPVTVKFAKTSTTTYVNWDAYQLFTCCLDRSKNLIKLHKAAHGKQAKPEKYMSDAHRASILLTISALDAFIRTFFIEKVRGLLANQTAPLPGPLKDKIKNLLKDEDLIEAARKNDLLERVEKAFKAEFERRSFQGTKVIEEYMQMLGFDKVFHTIAKNAKHNEETLCQDLEKFTKRRHNIAHRGDYDLTKNPPSELLVTKKEASDCIKLIETIGFHINKLGAVK